MSPGKLLLVKCCSLSISISGVLSECLLRISDIDVKYLFNSSAIFSDFVMFLSSIINSSGSVFEDVFCYQWIVNVAK